MKVTNGYSWGSAWTRPRGKRLLAWLGLLVVLAGCVHIPDRPGVNLSSIGQVDASCHHAQSSFPLPADDSFGLSPDQITVLSWNIYKESREDWQSDFQRLSTGRDLILLQEAMLAPALQGELEAARYHWAMTNAFYRDDVPSGVLTASPQQAIEHCSHYISEPLIRIPKSLLVSRYPVAGSSQTLLVANVHGINFTTGMGSYREQFDALAQVVAEHEGPIILAGDFNSWSQARLAVLNELAARLGLQRVGYSMHNRKLVFRHSIDHIYYRGLSIVQSYSPSVETSDHNPLLVTFRMDGET